MTVVFANRNEICYVVFLPPEAGTYSLYLSGSPPRKKEVYLFLQANPEDILRRSIGKLEHGFPGSTLTQFPKISVRSLIVDLLDQVDKM